MKNLRRNFERLCYRHRGKGIPNLMLWIAIATVLVYLLLQIDPSGKAVGWLAFSRSKILHGQIWRLLTWIIIPSGDQYFFLELIMLFFYYQIGRIIESNWGLFKFNLYYLCGVLMIDVVGLIFGALTLTGTYLNLSLLLAFATLYPENRVLLFFIIPLRMKYLAWFYFAMLAVGIVQCLWRYLLVAPLAALFGVLYEIVPLLNYFLFFGSDVKNVFSLNGEPSTSGFAKKRSTMQQRRQKNAAPNVNWASSYQSDSGQKPYHHKCTVCGRTDTEYPDLEFRYCSRCNGYYCYCIDHINNHAHIQ